MTEHDDEKAAASLDDAARGSVSGDHDKISVRPPDTPYAWLQVVSIFQWSSQSLLNHSLTTSGGRVLPDVQLLGHSRSVRNIPKLL